MNVLSAKSRVKIKADVGMGTTGAEGPEKHTEPERLGMFTEKQHNFAETNPEDKKTAAHRGEQVENEGGVILRSDAGIQPGTVVIEPLHALVASSAVLLVQ